MKRAIALVAILLLVLMQFSALSSEVHATLALSNGYVTPVTGDVSTPFYYYVTYYDSAGVAPALANVVIDTLGAQTMRLWNGVPSNGVYRYSTTLPVGTHNYYFRFNGGLGGTTYLPPPSTPYSGPTVNPLQRLLTVSCAHDSPNPPNGNWYFNDGQTVWCSVTSPVTEGGTLWTCTGWTGTGSVPSSGSGTIVSFPITQTSSITWYWQGSAVQRTLTVSSAHDTPVPSGGPHTYSDGQPVTCSVTSPVTESGTIWTCTGWSGTGSVPSSGSGTSVSFTITQDSTITWNWHGDAIQRKLTVLSAHDSPNPSVGDHYYSDSSSVTCSVTSPVTESGTVWTCTGWTGTGSVPSSGSGTTVTFTITQDSGITWNWASTSYIVTIGAHCNTEGIDVNASVSIDSSATYYTPHTFTGLSGIHTFTVSQYDENGHHLKQWSTGAITDTISVGAGGTFTAFYEADKKPVAVLTVQEDVVNIGTNVYFFGDTSYTPDGSKIKSFFFDFGDGNNSGWVNYPTVGATYAYTKPGQYNAKLIVINNESVESDWSTPHEITVLRTPSFPIAVLQVKPQEASVGTSITFNASLSTDPNGWISEYGFNFGDGSPIFWTTNPIIHHAYTQQGTYYSEVTVSDNSGLETVSGPIKVTIPKYYTDWKSYDHNYWYTEPNAASDPPCDSDTNLVFTLPAHDATFQQKVATKNTLSYGRFIIRFKMSPFVTGLLGSFFLYYKAPNDKGDSSHQEIDIEWWGKESSDYVHFVLWQNGGKYGDGTTPTEDHVTLLPFSLDDGKYHTCEIDYQQNSVSFIIDGVECYKKVIAITPPLYFFTGQVWAREWVPPADYKLYVDSTEIWQDSTAPKSALSVTAKSPVNLFLTDPQNRSIGTDPDTGQFVNEIPGAFYTGPYAEPQNIIIPEPLTGKYVLRASGTGSGPYTLTMECTVNDSVDFQTWQGIINGSDQVKEAVRLDADGVIVLPPYVRMTNIMFSKTIAVQGDSVSVNVTLMNEGNYTETFNVTLYETQIDTGLPWSIWPTYANQSWPIYTFTDVTLAPNSTVTLTFSMSSAMGTYTISAAAYPIGGRTYTSMALTLYVGLCRPFSLGNRFWRPAIPC